MTTRAEELLYNICGYLIELDDEFLDFEHNNICFGVSEEEHKKYFLGE